MFSEPTNESRAEEAAQCIELFMRLTRSDLEDAACDLIAGLCHWMRREGQDPYRQVDRALMHFDIEEQEANLEGNE